MKKTESGLAINPLSVFYFIWVVNYKCLKIVSSTMISTLGC